MSGFSKELGMQTWIAIEEAKVHACGGHDRRVERGDRQPMGCDEEVLMTRERVETYWSVWTFNDQLGEGHWKPIVQGLSTERAAEKERRDLEKQYPHERFAVVKTRHERRR